MKRRGPEPRFARERVSRVVAVGALLLMAGWVVAGPSGLLAWSDNLHQLDQRQQDVKRLTAERDELQNRVALLDPRHADPDLAGELLRSNLNVVHPDVTAMMLK